MISNGQEISFVDGGIYIVVDGRGGDLTYSKFLKLVVGKYGNVIAWVSDDRVNWRLYRDLHQKPKDLRWGATLTLDFVTPTEDKISELV